MNALERIRQRTRLTAQTDPVAAKAVAQAVATAKLNVTKDVLPLGAAGLTPAGAKLNGKLAIAQSDVGEYFQAAEMLRITKMAVRHRLDAGEIQEFNRGHVLGGAYEEGFRLFDLQAEAICEYELVGGGFCPIPVGFGKTLASLMIACAAWAKGIEKMILLVPPQVLGQLTTVDIKWARLRVPIPYPIHVLGSLSIDARRGLAKSGKKGLYIIPHSLLSTKDTSDLLDNIKAGLIIVDEAHALANHSSARTKRLMRYVDNYKPEGVCLSGTITSKSIRDYYHLIKWCLPKTNPLPNSSSLAGEWAVVIDANASSEDGGGTGALMPLIEWARRNFPQQPFEETTAGFRAAYRVRLATAPGVVSGGDAEIGTSLILDNEKVPQYELCEGWTHLKELADKVVEQWLTPNDDEIDHAIHTWKWLYELSSGFYNELRWPEPALLAERQRIDEAEADGLLEMAKAHHAAEQEYARELRGWLENDSKPNLDTPMLVGGDISRNADKNVGANLYKFWKRHKDLDFPGRPKREDYARAVRVCPYKINEVVKWAKALIEEDPKQGGIAWFYHNEMGEWIFDAMREAGIPNAVYCPAGEQYNAMLRDEAMASRIIVASISAHGQGKNLQYLRHQYFAQWPRSARIAEQTLGRLHRSGQMADELVVKMNNTLEFDELNFAACVNDALYIHQTTGNRQKLIYATYATLPKIFPSAVLYERGLQNKLLNREQQSMMEQKFGALVGAVA